jgi:HTH-type transcriptional regulator/antitoxin MqsA
MDSLVEIEMSVCNKCNSTDVTQASEVEVNTYKGSEYSVDIEYSTCNSCHREFLSKSQIIANETKVREAKKQINGLLSSEDIKAIRKSLNLSQADASIVFGGGQNAFSKYERSEVTQSQAMDKLLRLASSDRYIYGKLLGLSNLENKSHVVRSIEMSSLSTHNIENWTNSQFSISSATHEVSKPKLKLVA